MSGQDETSGKSKELRAHPGPRPPKRIAQQHLDSVEAVLAPRHLLLVAQGGKIGKDAIYALATFLMALAGAGTLGFINIAMRVAIKIGHPADEIYAAGKPIFQEIGQVCVKTAIGGAFIVLACRWRWARALLWLACAALLVMVQAKGRQRALFGALLLGVNLVILAGTYVSLIARALEAFVWFCVLGFVDAYLAALSGKDDGPTLPSRKELAIKVAVSGALAWWHRARIWRYFGALVLELFFILVTHLFFSLAGALAKEIVEQKLGKYAGILRPIIADAERRCSLAEAQLLGTQQRLDKLQKAQK